MKTYDVMIVNTKTKKIESIIGVGLSAERAERRIMTGVSRTNIGPYCVVDELHDPKRKVGDVLE